MTGNSKPLAPFKAKRHDYIVYLVLSSGFSNFWKWRRLWNKTMFWPHWLETVVLSKTEKNQYDRLTDSSKCDNKISFSKIAKTIRAILTWCASNHDVATCKCTRLLSLYRKLILASAHCWDNFEISFAFDNDQYSWNHLKISIYWIQFLNCKKPDDKTRAVRVAPLPWMRIWALTLKLNWSVN